MKKKMYRVYSDGSDGEYTEGYIKLTEGELEDLDCRDSDYEYEEVVASKGLGYLKLHREVIKNNTERLRREEEYNQWLENNPKEKERLEKRNAERGKLLDKANGDFRKVAELTGKFMAEDIEESMFSSYLKLVK